MSANAVDRSLSPYLNPSPSSAVFSSVRPGEQLSKQHPLWPVLPYSWKVLSFCWSSKVLSSCWSSKVLSSTLWVPY